MSDSERTSFGRRGIVASAFPAASDAGREVFAAGGNAIDAAVATAWALSVCEPSGSGLGGQTVLLLRLADGRTIAIDGHSHAPNAVSRRSVTRVQQQIGHRATTVPTTPATLAYVQDRYGKLSLPRVLEPAMRLAEDGFEVTRLQSRQLAWCQASLAATPAASRFLQEGRPFRAGEVFRQPQLAFALHRIAKHGIDDFYRGAIARAIVADMRECGGLLEAGDLEDDSLLIERTPVSTVYRGHQVVSIPPPGGGVELLFALRLLEQLEDGSPSNDLDSWYVRLAEVIYTAFAERERDPAHPDAWTAAQAISVLGRGRAEGIASSMQERALVPVGADFEEPGETTHLCAADEEGNVVSLTQSIQSLFGAKVANPEYGFLYNNYLTTCPRRRHAYRLRERCRARSNAAPTMVFGASQDVPPLFALGAAGSRRIVSSLLHVISGLIDRGMSLPEALDGPRLHPRLSGRVWLERPAATPALCAALRGRFRAVELRGGHSYSMGAVQAVAIASHGCLTGAADPRRDGTVASW
jgi:gamma-glutamyltranspeptidase/glutathione hydrolase